MSFRTALARNLGSQKISTPPFVATLFGMTNQKSKIKNQK